MRVSSKGGKENSKTREREREEKLRGEGGRWERSRKGD